VALARDTTEENVKPLDGAKIRRYTAGAAIEAGEIVSMMADGYVDPADTTDFTAACVVGIALQDVAAGERVDVVTQGPVTAFTGGTPGTLVYATDTATAGEPSVTNGTKIVLVGVMESATTLFVRPEFIDRS
jgi:hypothetical protein